MPIPRVLLLAALAATLCTHVRGEATQCIPDGLGGLGDACRNDFDCPNSLACVGGACGRTAQAEALACTDRSDCGLVNMDCVDGACKLLRGHGDTCTAGDDCSSGSCVAGKCQGLALGATCDPAVAPQVCAFPLFCAADGTCKEPLQKDDSCADEAAAIASGAMAMINFLDICGGSSTCDGAPGEEVCLPALSLREGDVCGPALYGCNINAGLSCEREYASDSPYGTCTKLGHAGAPCVGGLGCASGHQCFCNGDGSQNGTCRAIYNSAGCAAEQTSFLLCGVVLECPKSTSGVSLPDSLRGRYNALVWDYDGSCWASCKEKLERLLCCFRGSEYRDTYPLPEVTCLGDDDDDDDSSGALRVGAGVWVALLPALLALAVWRK